MLCEYIGVNQGINFGMNLGIKNRISLIKGLANTHVHNIFVGLHICYTPTHNKLD
jgi:hypothetical protein